MSQTSNAIPASHKDVLKSLSSSFKKAVVESYAWNGDVFVVVSAESLLQILDALKSEHHFIALNDVFGIDRYTEQDRFEVVYNLVDLKNGRRLFVKTRCSEQDPVLDSVTGIWPNAEWHEREVFDMFGVRFTGNPDLRRVYLPEDFEYFPLRKEFPLLGIPGSIELPVTTPDRE